MACNAVGCVCRDDFLPFTCILCGGSFCSTHRSRFSHGPCAESFGGYLPTTGGAAAAGQAADAKALLNSVGLRFLTSVDDGSGGGGKSHGVAVRTAAVPDGLLPSEGTASRIDKLAKIGASSSSARERKISNKAKEILMKTNAIGNASIAANDRLYLNIRFLGEVDDTTAAAAASNSSGSRSSSSSSNNNNNSSGGPAADSVNFFFKRSTPLGETLHHTGLAFPQLCYGAATVPEGKALAMASADTPNWASWDRSLPIEQVLLNFEDVTIHVVPLACVVSAQLELEGLKRRLREAVAEAEAAARAEAVAEADAALAAEGEADVLRHPLTKGEQVHYFSKGTPGVEPVTVVGVHLDDFPNVYYTVRFDGPDAGGREKQTDHYHLRRTNFSAGGSGIGGAPAGAQQTRLVVDGGVAGAALNLKVNHGGKVYELGDGIGDKNTVGQLKELIERYSGVAVKAQKLVYKGVVLKEAGSDLKGARLANGSKITLIGASSR